MSFLLTFVIPVRHQDNATDWTALCARLAQTAASIAAQDSGDWRAVVVVNYGANLPPLPPGFDVVRVEFEPNPHYDRGTENFDIFYDFVRIDKGRRILAGMLAARDSRFFMVVDDDDFVHRGILTHVAANSDSNGWTIDRGYVWTEGSSLLVGHDEFNKLCGTSLIVRTDLYDLPDTLESADLQWIKVMLGSHIMIADRLRERGAPLASLPFRGAVYRVGHAGAHSGSRNALQSLLLDPARWRRPRRQLRTLLSMRWIGEEVRHEFFGEQRVWP